jgi:hypothetical protein
MELCCHFFEGEMGDASALPGVFHRNCTNTAFGIHIDDCILIKIACLHNLSATKFDIQGISVLEILDLHRLKLRSKKTLCTVSTSGSNTTLR